MARRTVRTITVAICTLLVLTIPLGQATAQTGTMQLNVKNAPVQEVLKLIAESGDFNLAIGGGVKGSVTLFVDDMPPRDLLDVVIGIVDAAYVEEKGALWVMSKESYLSRYGEMFVDKRVSRTFVLKQAKVKEIMPSVKMLLGDKAVIKPDLARNLIRIKASPKLLQEAAQMLAAMDTPSVTRAYQLHNMPAKMAGGLIGKMTTDQTSIVEDEINQRLVISSSAFELDRIGEVIDLLDGGGGGVQTIVLELGFANPDSMAEAMRPHLTPDVGLVYADNRSHKMVVVDYPPTLETISRLVTEFDIPQRQVLIEAKLIQVITSREVRSGINWDVLQDKINISGSFPALDELGPGIRGDFGDLSTQDYQVVIEALETFGETKLLSSPRLMVIDGGKGMIHVGSQVPYKTIDTRETAAGTVNQFETVVIVEVGVKLEVQVTIHGDGLIGLVVRPEVSSVTGVSNDVPIVDAATVESALLVEDGNTVILGGLIKDESRKVRKGVPLLASIPLLKYLFSSNVTEELQSELVILLTPRIMTGREAYQEEVAVSHD